MERCEGRKEQTWSKSIRKLSAGARNVEARAKRALNFLVSVIYIENIPHKETIESKNQMKPKFGIKA